MPEGPVATIDLRALGANLARVRARLPAATHVLAAVKANAYGHGDVPVARHLARLGVAWLGVATPSEALALRAAGVAVDILVFSPVYARIAELVEAGVTLTVAGQASLDAILAARPPGAARVHLKVDCGMARLGAPPSGALELALAAARAPGVELEGAWTHFARADEPDADATETQLATFHAFLDMLDRHRMRPRWIHAANSAAVFAAPGAAFDLVRPGIALYGYHAGPALGAIEPGLVPALTLRAPITFVKRIAAGTPVSYGHTWRAPRDTTLATVRCGYADGYPRSLSNVATVRVAGAAAPVVGRVCMDQLLVDVGDADVSEGDMVTLFGPQGPTAADLAAGAGTIPYEILTSIAPRVERRYVGAAPDARERP